MENEKKKHTKKIMAILSVIIIILGMACATGVYYELSNQISSQTSGLYIDGTDVSGIIGIMGKAGALVLSVLIVLASFLAVGLQWLTYYIVNLIKQVIKNKQKNMNMPNNNNPFENNNTYGNNIPPYYNQSANNNNPFQNNTYGNNPPTGYNPFTDNNNANQ